MELPRVLVTTNNEDSNGVSMVDFASESNNRILTSLRDSGSFNGVVVCKFAELQQFFKQVTPSVILLFGRQRVEALQSDNDQIFEKVKELSEKFRPLRTNEDMFGKFVVLSNLQIEKGKKFSVSLNYVIGEDYQKISDDTKDAEEKLKKANRFIVRYPRLGNKDEFNADMATLVTVLKARSAEKPTLPKLKTKRAKTPEEPAVSENDSSDEESSAAQQTSSASASAPGASASKAEEPSTSDVIDLTAKDGAADAELRKLDGWDKTTPLKCYWPASKNFGAIRDDETFPVLTKLKELTKGTNIKQLIKTIQSKSAEEPPAGKPVGEKPTASVDAKGTSDTKTTPATSTTVTAAAAAPTTPSDDQGVDTGSVIDLTAKDGAADAELRKLDGWDKTTPLKCYWPASKNFGAIRDDTTFPVLTKLKELTKGTNIKQLIKTIQSKSAEEPPAGKPGPSASNGSGSKPASGSLTPSVPIQTPLPAFVPGHTSPSPLGSRNQPPHPAPPPKPGRAPASNSKKYDEPANKYPIKILGDVGSTVSTLTVYTTDDVICQLAAALSEFGSGLAESISDVFYDVPTVFRVNTSAPITDVIRKKVMSLDGSAASNSEPTIQTLRWAMRPLAQVMPSLTEHLFENAQYVDTVKNRFDAMHVRILKADNTEWHVMRLRDVFIAICAVRSVPQLRMVVAAQHWLVAGSAPTGGPMTPRVGGGGGGNSGGNIVGGNRTFPSFTGQQQFQPQPTASADNGSPQQRQSASAAAVPGLQSQRAATPPNGATEFQQPLASTGNGGGQQQHYSVGDSTPAAASSLDDQIAKYVPNMFPTTIRDLIANPYKLGEYGLIKTGEGTIVDNGGKGQFYRALMDTTADKLSRLQPLEMRAEYPTWKKELEDRIRYWLPSIGEFAMRDLLRDPAKLKEYGLIMRDSGSINDNDGEKMYHTALLQELDTTTEKSFNSLSKLRQRREILEWKQKYLPGYTARQKKTSMSSVPADIGMTGPVSTFGGTLQHQTGVPDTFSAGSDGISPISDPGLATGNNQLSLPELDDLQLNGDNDSVPPLLQSAKDSKIKAQILDLVSTDHRRDVEQMYDLNFDISKILQSLGLTADPLNDTVTVQAAPPDYDDVGIKTIATLDKVFTAVNLSEMMMLKNHQALANEMMYYNQYNMYRWIASRQRPVSISETLVTKIRNETGLQLQVKDNEVVRATPVDTAEGEMPPLYRELVEILNDIGVAGKKTLDTLNEKMKNEDTKRSLASTQTPFYNDKLELLTRIINDRGIFSYNRFDQIGEAGVLDCFVLFFNVNRPNQQTVHYIPKQQQDALAQLADSLNKFAENDKKATDSSVKQVQAIQNDENTDTQSRLDSLDKLMLDDAALNREYQRAVNLQNFVSVNYRGPNVNVNPTVILLTTVLTAHGALKDTINVAKRQISDAASAETRRQKEQLTPAKSVLQSYSAFDAMLSKMDKTLGKAALDVLAQKVIKPDSGSPALITRDDLVQIQAIINDLDTFEVVRTESMFDDVVYHVLRFGDKYVNYMPIQFSTTLSSKFAELTRSVTAETDGCDVLRGNLDTIRDRKIYDLSTRDELVALDTELNSMKKKIKDIQVVANKIETFVSGEYRDGTKASIPYNGGISSGQRTKLTTSLATLTENAETTSAELGHVSDAVNGVIALEATFLQSEEKDQATMIAKQRDQVAKFSDKTKAMVKTLLKTLVNRVSDQTSMDIMEPIVQDSPFFTPSERNTLIREMKARVQAPPPSDPEEVPDGGSQKEEEYDADREGPGMDPATVDEAPDGASGNAEDQSDDNQKEEEESEDGRPKPQAAAAPTASGEQFEGDDTGDTRDFKIDEDRENRMRRFLIDRATYKDDGLTWGKNTTKEILALDAVQRANDARPEDKQVNSKSNKDAVDAWIKSLLPDEIEAIIAEYALVADDSADSGEPEAAAAVPRATRNQSKKPEASPTPGAASTTQGAASSSSPDSITTSKKITSQDFDQLQGTYKNRQPKQGELVLVTNKTTSQYGFVKRATLSKDNPPRYFVKSLPDLINLNPTPEQMTPARISINATPERTEFITDFINSQLGK